MRASHSRIAASLVVALVLLVALVWLLVGNAVGYRPAVVAAPTASGPGHRWRGALHVHTSSSGDARGTVEEVAAAAATAGLDFVLISEHTRAGGAEARPRDGWYGDVLVVVGEEISTSAGHLLALGGATHRYALGPTPRQAIDDIHELGGGAVVAHPVGGELAWSNGWAGISGIEVVNFAGALNRLSWVEFAGGLVRYLVSPAAAAVSVFGTRDPAIDLWDLQTRLRGNPRPRWLAALGAVDAHGPIGVLGIPNYAATFRALSTMVWLDAGPRPGEAPRRQAAAVIEALVAGRAAVILDAVGAAPGFTLQATHATRPSLLPGAIAPWETGWSIRAGLGGPGPYRIVLLADGEVVAEGSGEDLVYPAVTAATYRVEVYRTDGPVGVGQPGATLWIISNPIYLWPPEAIVESRLQRAPRLPAPPTDASLFVAPGWAAESDESSMSALALAPDGLRWDLRVPAQGAAEPFAAVAWRPERGADWSAAAGVAVQLRATEAWRVALRLQVGRGDAVETWERIVPAEPASRGVGVRWSDFLAIDPGGGYAAHRALSATDVHDVRAVLLVVTPDLMKPRTATRIDVTRLGAFGRVP